MNIHKQNIVATNSKRDVSKLSVLPNKESNAQNKIEKITRHKADIKSSINLKSKETVYATGKRKTAIAKVWITSNGVGRIVVNKKNITDYFQRSVNRMIVNQPFLIIDADKMYNVECQVLGSGLSGQAGAIRHGISRALKKLSNEFHQRLRSGGFLTRDSRKVERKKYGQPKARKKFQFSKR